MNLGNYIDIAIIIYIAYSLLQGLKNGFVKTMFVSFGFLAKVALTYFIFTNYSHILLEDKNVLTVIDFLYKFIIKYMPNLETVRPILNTVLLILMIYLVLSLIMIVIELILIQTTKSKTLKAGDKILGMIFGIVKAVVILMLIVYVFDKFSDYILKPETKNQLSNSIFLPKLYLYNIFMHLFPS